MDSGFPEQGSSLKSLWSVGGFLSVFLDLLEPTETLSPLEPSASFPG